MAEFGRVLFMRHPQTVSNVEHFFSGRLDVGLSELGKRQAAEAADALVAWRPDRIVTSPLSRCHAIADAAAEALGIEVIEDERLIEIEFGAIEGVPVAELSERGFTFPWPIVDGHSVTAEGGESFEELIARARSFVSWVATQPGKTACVTHGGLTRAVFAAVYDIPVERFWYHVFVNVSSQVFVSNGRHLVLQTSGLLPAELKARAELGLVPAGDIGTSLALLANNTNDSYGANDADITSDRHNEKG